METKKIIKVLKYIKKYCDARDCDCCMFGNNNSCTLSDGTGSLPTFWDIEYIEKKLKCTDKL